MNCNSYTSPKLGMNLQSLSDRDICTKFITPPLKKSGWDEMSQIREEVSFTKGRIIVRGQIAIRGKAKRADYILYIKPNIPIALIEAKDANHSPRAVTLGIPFVFHDRTCASPPQIQPPH